MTSCLSIEDKNYTTCFLKNNTTYIPIFKILLYFKMLIITVKVPYLKFFYRGASPLYIFFVFDILTEMMKMIYIFRIRQSNRRFHF